MLMTNFWVGFIFENLERKYHLKMIRVNSFPIVKIVD